MKPYNVPLDALFADGPAPAFADKLQLLGQFVGSWELDVVYRDPTGERRLSAEWHFGWTLNGRAVQGVWIAPSRRDRQRGEPPVDWGTTIRFYDPRIDAWRSTWIGPVKGFVLPFIARPIGDKIVLEGRFDDDKLPISALLSATAIGESSLTLVRLLGAAAVGTGVSLGVRNHEVRSVQHGLADSRGSD
jgi:hypothetical protein